jgi:hypothetical protein
MESRLRAWAEVIGLIAVVGSLVFVGLELKLTRDMNLAQLQYNRLSLYMDGAAAVLQSEDALKMYGKRFLGDWDAGDLTPTEKAAAEINAQIMLVEWEYEYRLIQQGYSLRTFDDLQGDVQTMMHGYPEVRVAIGTWTDSDSYEFNNFIKALLDAEPLSQ